MTEELDNEGVGRPRGYYYLVNRIDGTFNTKGDLIKHLESRNLPFSKVLVIRGKVQKVEKVQTSTYQLTGMK